MDLPLNSSHVYFSWERFHDCLSLQGQDEFMGRCVVTPLVKLHGQGAPSPRLLWYDVQRGDEEGGQILCAFELFLVSCRSGSNETDKCSNFMVSSFLAANRIAVVVAVAVIVIAVIIVIKYERGKDIT